jgi:hypothetical protein
LRRDHWRRLTRRLAIWAGILKPGTGDLWPRSRRHSTPAADGTIPRCVRGELARIAWRWGNDRWTNSMICRDVIGYGADRGDNEMLVTTGFQSHLVNLLMLWLMYYSFFTSRTVHKVEQSGVENNNQLRMITIKTAAPGTYRWPLMWKNWQSILFDPAFMTPKVWRHFRRKRDNNLRKSRDVRYSAGVCCYHRWQLLWYALTAGKRTIKKSYDVHLTSKQLRVKTLPNNTICVCTDDHPIKVFFEKGK